MIAELYHVNLKSNQQDFGSGIVTVEEGKAYGRDYACYYQARIADESASLKITRFNHKTASVSGPIKECHLELKVKPVMGYPVPEGSVQGMPNMKIQIHAKLFAPLD